MSAVLLTDVRIVRPGWDVTRGDVLVEGGRIAAVGRVDPGRATSAARVPGGGRLLTPGLIDVHTHGVGLALYETGADGLRRAARELGRFGVTAVVPTVIPRGDEAGFALLRELAAALPGIREVAIPGLHLEGPFMAVGGAACPTLPGDVALLDRLLDAAGGRVAIMSVSPDTPGIVPVIRRLRERGVVVFLTHTRATVEQTEAALAAGATHATHFYDVFYPPAETDPGVRPVGAVEVLLGDPRATVDFIADGVHVHPAAIRLAVAAKGFGGVVLVTDSNIGAGLPEGTYDTPWGYAVRVRPGDAARHAQQGFLAGSALTMNRGIANLQRWLGRPPHEIWAMGTSNPARLLGLTDKGRLDPGADADLVLWNDDFTPAKTWVGGQCTYEEARA